MGVLGKTNELKDLQRQLDDLTRRMNELNLALVNSVSRVWWPYPVQQALATTPWLIPGNSLPQGAKITLGDPTGARIELTPDGKIVAYDARNRPYFSLGGSDDAALTVGYTEGEAGPGTLRLRGATLDIDAATVRASSADIGTVYSETLKSQYFEAYQPAGQDRITITPLVLEVYKSEGTKLRLYVSGDMAFMELYDGEVLVQRMTISQQMFTILAPILRRVFTTGYPPETTTDWQVGPDVSWLRSVVPLQFAKASVGTGEEIIPYLGINEDAPVPPILTSEDSAHRLVYVHARSAPSSTARDLSIRADGVPIKTISLANGSAYWCASPEPWDEEYQPVEFTSGLLSVKIGAGEVGLSEVSVVVGVA